MRIFAFFVSVFAAFAGSQSWANTIYNFGDSQAQLSLFASGTITTDGKIGVLTVSDIVSWDITITGSGVSPPFTIAGPSSITSVILIGDALNATETSFVWDSSAPSSSLIFSTNDNVVGDLKGFVLYENTGAPVHSFFELIVEDVRCGTPGFGCGETVADSRSGLEVIATATPLPSSLSLLITGIGALGFLCWRRTLKLYVPLQRPRSY